MSRLWIGLVLLLVGLLLLPAEPALCAAVYEQDEIGSGGGGGSGGGVLCGAAPTYASALWRPYVGIGEEYTSVDQCVDVGKNQLFVLWVWWRPGSRGMKSAEFKVDFPEGISVLEVASNPSISTQSGDLETGISVAFSECQTDWVWTHQVFCWLTTEEYGAVTVDPFPGFDEVQLEACDSDHSTEWPFAFILEYNSCSMCPPTPKPAVVGVTIESTDVIRALIDSESFPCSCPSIKECFYLVNAADTADTVHCVDGYSESLGTEYVLTLERAMTDGVAYQLHTCGLCFDAVGGRSKYEFTFHVTVATLLQSCTTAFLGSGIELKWELSEVDGGVAFFVSRSENGADFVALDMSSLDKDGLGFRYVDSGIEPEKRYVYRVEYTIDGKSRLLFLSEEVRTPAALLALSQNRPNPFNPTTMISYSLPVDGVVRLEVYDVSGRLVSRLIDGERFGAGTHNIEWNGRDASGRAAASGIYVYRLVAGKETISRKMVLLR